MSKDKTKETKAEESAGAKDIKEIDENALDQDSKALWYKAQSAYELGHYSYAVKLCHSVLDKHPGFLDSRKLARSSAAAETAGKKVKKGFFGGGGHPKTAKPRSRWL